MLRLLAERSVPGRAAALRSAPISTATGSCPGDPSGAWWRRERLSGWLPVLSADDARLLAFLDAYGWRDVPIDREVP